MLRTRTLLLALFGVVEGGLLAVLASRRSDRVHIDDVFAVSFIRQRFIQPAAVLGDVTFLRFREKYVTSPRVPR